MACNGPSPIRPPTAPYRAIGAAREAAAQLLAAASTLAEAVGAGLALHTPTLCSAQPSSVAANPSLPLHVVSHYCRTLLEWTATSILKASTKSSRDGRKDKDEGRKGKAKGPTEPLGEALSASIGAATAEVRGCVNAMPCADSSHALEHNP